MTYRTPSHSRFKKLFTYKDGDIYYSNDKENGDKSNTKIKVSEADNFDYSRIRRSKASWVFFYFNKRFPMHKLLFIDGDYSNSRIDNIIDDPMLDHGTVEHLRFYYKYKNGMIYNKYSGGKGCRVKGRKPFEKEYSGKSKIYISIGGRSRPLINVIWEYHNGAIPRGYEAKCIDGNRKNAKIENIHLVNIKTGIILKNTKKKKITISKDVVKKVIPIIGRWGLVCKNKNELLSPLMDTKQELDLFLGSHAS